MIKCEWFDIEELVSEPVFKKYGESAWRFFDPRLLTTIDWIRERIDKSMTINTWIWRGNLSQRGLRENTCNLVSDRTDKGIIYLSGHVLGMAVDFDVERMTSKEFQFWLDEVQNELPYPIRIEKGVSWNHLDVIDMGDKIYYFNA